MKSRQTPKASKPKRRAQAVPLRKARAAEKPSALTRRIDQLLAERDAERARAARARSAARRAADRRLAALVQEIATLRHHEARSDALTRLLAERDRTLVAQAERIQELEHLLRTHTKLG